MRREKFIQSQGENKLEVRGGPLEVALFVGGTPLIYDAADCEGSIGRFTVMLEDVHPQITSHIETAAASGFDDAALLSAQIAPLLKLLANGEYTLTLASMREGSLQYAFDDYQYDETSLWYIPYAHLPGYQIADVYLGTQPESSLRDKVVNRYPDSIDKGIRPALITLGAKNHVARFVLDGHHKWFAYWCCGVMPTVLHIEAEHLTPIPASEAEQLLANSKRDDISSYLRWKKKNKLLKLVHHN